MAKTAEGNASDAGAQAVRPSDVSGAPVVYEPMVWSDLPDVVRAYDDMWGHCSVAASDPEISQLLSRRLVLRYLMPSTHAEVARRAGRFMGVMLLRLQGGSGLFGGKAEQEAGRIENELHSSTLGARALEQAVREHDDEKEMERSAGTQVLTQAEVELFLVAGAARGQGVGGTLWSRGMEFFDRMGVAKFFLHTDSSCDVSFYDAHGLECVERRRRPAEEGQGDDEAFIYIGEPTHVLEARHSAGAEAGHGGVSVRTATAVKGNSEFSGKAVRHGR